MDPHPAPCSGHGLEEGTPGKEEGAAGADVGARPSGGSRADGAGRPSGGAGRTVVAQRPAVLLLLAVGMKTAKQGPAEKKPEGLAA